MPTAPNDADVAPPANEPLALSKRPRRVWRSVDPSKRNAMSVSTALAAISTFTKLRPGPDYSFHGCAGGRQVEAEGAMSKTRQKVCWVIVSSGIETLVFYPMWVRGVATEAAFFVFFVIRIVACEPHDLAIAFESEDVRRDSIQEPAIMRNHDG